MDHDDFTQDLWDVMGQEHIYPVELSIEDQKHLFQLWLERNPGAVKEMEDWALMLDMMGQHVSVQYLFEKHRYEGHTVMHPVPFHVEGGEIREYGINHNDRALFGRWLKRRHPSMHVSLRKSKFDEKPDSDDEREQVHQQLIDGFADWLQGISIDRQIFGR